MVKIFISYRRLDSQDFTDRLFEHMAKHFEPENVFQDVGDSSKIPPGVDFVEYLAEQVSACDVVLVVIGEQWTRILQERLRRDDDFVRIEVESALAQKKIVIPVLKSGTPMPASADLPDSIKKLARINASRVRPNPDFVRDCNTLADGIRQVYGSVSPASTPPPAKAAEAPKPQPKPTPAPAKATEAPKPQPKPTPAPAKATEAPKPTPPQPKPNPATADAVKRVLGEPFDWCEVPAGEFLYGENKQKRMLPAFAIAKYPITYSQFQVFINAQDGFKEGRWWDGLAENQSDKPGDQWQKIKDHPRENVSWTDAMAFCRWLSFKLDALTPTSLGDAPSPSGRGAYDLMNPATWLIRLPTEFEWEKAARGTDGRLYPYGNDFDRTKGNTSESDIGKTTPVTAYPQGASPYGVMDMSGNVWEWCLSDFDNPVAEASSENVISNSRRVLRGGSWDDGSSYARAVFRDYGVPSYRDVSFGFRLVRAPSL